MARASAARKIPTNVSVRADLVKRARELGLNLSGVLETALEESIRAAEREAWRRENEEAIDYYNEWIEKHGSFADQWRRF